MGKCEKCGLEFPMERGRHWAVTHGTWKDTKYFCCFKCLLEWVLWWDKGVRYG
jgi:hypothetical protein